MSVQAATFGMTNCRRQRPFWITSGMLAPIGTLVRVNAPFSAVVALTSGEPEKLALQLLSHATPGAKGATAAPGT